MATISWRTGWRFPTCANEAAVISTIAFKRTCLGIEVSPERYMAAWRHWFFVIYTIASTVYRWVLTVTILFFLAKWLKPYKLETLSILLAIAAMASQFGWPLYRLIRNIRKRGRMPDMKRNRVIITCTVGAGLLGAFFFLPLPLNRVRRNGPWSSCRRTPSLTCTSANRAAI